MTAPSPYKKSGRISSRTFVVMCLAVALPIFFALWLALHIIDPFWASDRQIGLYFRSAPPTIHQYKRLLSKDPYTLVFGTSRSHLLSDELVQEPVLNLHTVYGNPLSVNHFLQSLDSTQRGHIRHIIYLLDIHTFKADKNLVLDYSDNPVRNALYEIQNMRALMKLSVERIKKNLSGDSDYYIHRRGYKVLTRPVIYDGIIRNHGNDLRFDPAVVAVLKDIKAFAVNNHITIDFITPTFPTTSLPTLDPEQIINQRQAIVNAIGDYAELSYVSGISDDWSLFADESHLNTAGTKALFALYPWKDYRVTPDNAAAVFKKLKLKMQDPHAF